MANNSLTIIDLFRHGDTNSGKCYIGSTDCELSDKGRQQMRTATQDNISWDVIFSSPLKRCACYATELSEKNAIPLTIMDTIQEIDFGDWEAQTATELLLLDPAAIKQFWSNPISNTPPNGEHYSNFKTRVLSAWHSIIRDSVNKHTCVVTHAGVIRTIVQGILDIPDQNLFHFDIKHAGFTRIEINGCETDSSSRVMFLNGKL